MKYYPGAIVEGFVTGIQPYGAFVDIEGTAGLIHISEITSGYVSDVCRFVNVGDKVRVKIIDIDQQNAHYQLSLKALLPNMIRKEKREIIFGGIPQFKIGFQSVAFRLPKWLKEIKEINY